MQKPHVVVVVVLIGRSILSRNSGNSWKAIYSIETNPFAGYEWIAHAQCVSIDCVYKKVHKCYIMKRLGVSRFEICLHKVSSTLYMYMLLTCPLVFLWLGECVCVPPTFWRSRNSPKNSETHFKVVVVSDEFTSLKTLLARHRRVNAILKEELDGPVHALSIVAKTPTQWHVMEETGASTNIEASPSCRGGDGSLPPKHPWNENEWGYTYTPRKKTHRKCNIYRLYFVLVFRINQLPCHNDSANHT